MNDVTIIIPHYNAWQYLQRAVLSAKLQTVPCDMIVIDQCSAWPKEPCVDLSGVTLVRQATKLSWSETLNQGVRMANTRFIVPLNADDTIALGMVELCLKLADSRTDVEVVFPSCLPIDNRVYHTNLHPYCALISRNLWWDLAGYHDVPFADWDFWIRAYQRSLMIFGRQACAGDGLFHWTDRPDGETARMKASGEYDRAIAETRERWAHCR